MSYYYLYLIKFEDGRFYIGSRKSKVPANEDVNYWGSPGKINKHLWEMQKEKHILLESTDISLQDLRKKEYEMIRKGWEKFGKDNCVNKNAGGLNSITDGVRKKCAKVGGERIKELGIGIHALTSEEKSEVGKIGGERSKELGVGIHGLSKEERIENSKKAGKKAKELGIGVHGLTAEQRTQNGKSGYERSIKNFSKQKREEICKIITEKFQKEFELKSPSGEIVGEKNLRKFCRDNNLDRPSINKVLNEKQKHYKGWTKP